MHEGMQYAVKSNIMNKGAGGRKERKEKRKKNKIKYKLISKDNL